jgi:2-polyprenyl-6-methoxyphenol hydroxylase-like FAD-dependent oxidoreductase
MRIIVIGSGIAGLTTAIALRKVGIEVAVYERAPELREVGAGISLWANALRALDHIGAGESVRAVSLKMTRSEIRGKSGRSVLVALDAAAMEGRAGMPELVRMIHRAELVGALAAHLPAGVAHYGHECVSVEADGTAARVRFANGRTDSADAVIGADGIRSVVRTAILGASEPRYAGYTGWRGVCPRPASVEAGYIGEWWGRGLRFGIATLPNDRIYWFVGQNAPQNGRNADERGHLLAAFAGWPAPIRELIGSTADVLRNDIIDRPPVREWSKGRLCVIGDAAHPMTPNLGQGGCTAIEDGVILARHLSRATDVPAALTAFARERYKRTAGIVKESWQLGAVAQWEGRVSCALRDRLMWLAGKVMGAGAILKHAKFDTGPL